MSYYLFIADLTKYVKLQKYVCESRINVKIAIFGVLKESYTCINRL